MTNEMTTAANALLSLAFEIEAHIFFDITDADLVRWSSQIKEVVTLSAATPRQEVIDAQRDEMWDSLAETQRAIIESAERRGYDRARSDAQQPVSTDAIATLYYDGFWTWKGTPPHESNYAGWKLDVYAAPESAAAQQPDRVEDRRCQCDACRADGNHDNCCAVHNAPAMPVGPCDCSKSEAAQQPVVDELLLTDLDRWLRECPDPTAVTPKWLIKKSSRLLWRCRAALRSTVAQQPASDGKENGNGQ